MSNARLMKPLFYDGNFNRDGKKMRAVFEREISDGTVSYRLYFFAMDALRFILKSAPFFIQLIADRNFLINAIVVFDSDSFHFYLQVVSFADADERIEGGPRARLPAPDMDHAPSQGNKKAGHSHARMVGSLFRYWLAHKGMKKAPRIIDPRGYRCSSIIHYTC